jgi:hypothetical protein
MDIRTIIKLAGNGPSVARAARAIAEASRRTEFEVTAEAVVRWPRYSIPERHWPLITAMSGGQITATELHQANVALRSRSAVPFVRGEVIAAAA